MTTCSKLDWLLRHGEKYLRPETRSSPLILGYKKSEVHYEPLGVVAAIVSWNYRMTLFSPPSRNIDHLQRYTILGPPFWLHSLLAMPLSSSVQSTSLGRRHGSSTPSRNVYGSVTLIPSWYRYAFFLAGRRSLVIRCCFPSKKLVCCLPDQAEGITRSPKIKHITFIGSEHVGRLVGLIKRIAWHVI